MKFPKQSSTYISIIVSLLWLVVMVSGFYYFFSHDVSLEGVIFGMQDYIRANVFIGICLFVVIYVIRPLFFITATPFDIFSGMVFGPVLGFFVSSISTLLSTMFSYWIGYLTGGIVLEKKNFKRLEKLKEKLRKRTFRTTFMMRLIMLPFDLSNYICGVLKAPYIQYVLGTWIGVLPATAVFVGAGAAFYGKDINDFDTLLQNINYYYLMLSSVFFFTIIIISRILKQRNKDISF